MAKAPDESPNEKTGQEPDVRAELDDATKQRLMAVVDDEEYNRGRRLARVLIHPSCYAAAQRDPDVFHDPGWLVLYRMMIWTIEDWCAENPDAAGEIATRMTRDGMIRLFYKEKWGAMRWNVHLGDARHPGLAERVRRMDSHLECASRFLCLSCGRTSVVRQPIPTDPPGTGWDGWVSTTCDDCATRWFYLTEEFGERDWAARFERRIPAYRDVRSKTERAVDAEDYVASLKPGGFTLEAEKIFAYAEDVLAEWDPEPRSLAAALRETAPAPPIEPKPYEVECGRWVYETATVTVDARDAEEAADLARKPREDLEWAPAEGRGPAFVRVVRTEHGLDLTTLLRIDENAGETHALETRLEERRNRMKDAARQANRVR